MENIMAKDYSKHIYNSQKWKNLRKQVAEESFYICQLCCKPTYSNEGIVHHKTRVDESNVGKPEITFNKENLIYICRECHGKIHNRERKRKNGREILYDDDGNLLFIDDDATQEMP